MVSGGMRIVLRAAAIVGFALVLVSPARAVCNGNCEPSVEVAQAAMQRFSGKPFSALHAHLFERLDGRSGER